jgi:hypothetical protein
MDTISMTAMFSLRMVPTSEGKWAIAVSIVRYVFAGSNKCQIFDEAAKPLCYTFIVKA